MFKFLGLATYIPLAFVSILNQQHLISFLTQLPADETLEEITSQNEAANNSGPIVRYIFVPCALSSILSHVIVCLLWRPGHHPVDSEPNHSLTTQPENHLEIKSILQFIYYYYRNSIIIINCVGVYVYVCVYSEDFPETLPLSLNNLWWCC